MDKSPLEIRLPFAAFAFAALLGVVPALQPVHASSDQPVAAERSSAEDSTADRDAAAADAPDTPAPGPAHELSVAPNTYPVYPDNRPVWVDHPGPEDEGDAVRWTIASIPMSSRDASEAALRIQMRDALARYAKQAFGADVSISPAALSDEWIEKYLVDPTRRYSGTFETTDGLMYEDAVQLVFDRGVQPELRKAVQQVQTEIRERVLQQRLGRLGALGGIALLGMAGLSVVMRGASHLGRRRKDESQ